MFDDRKRLLKYSAFFFIGIFAVGASTYVVMPYARDNIRPTNPELYGLIYYYPIFALIILAAGGFLYSRRTVIELVPVEDRPAKRTRAPRRSKQAIEKQDKFGLDE